MAAKFFEDLWESIFTPGPTPSLLKATNISFACLQVLLFVLLVVTYSVHFIILSGLCAGLWWAVNWFAAELAASQEREEREKKAAAAKAAGGGGGGGATSADDDETETEVEPTSVEASAASLGEGRGGKTPAAASREVDPFEKHGELKHRSANAAPSSPPPPYAETAGTQSSASTEDEWERVSSSENEKDK
jgi:hypothetical protein